MTVDLMKEQMELEMGMKDAGVVRFRKMLARMIKSKTQDETTYGNKLIGAYILPVSEELERWLEEGRGSAGANRIAQPYLEAIDSKTAAMLTLKVLCSQLMSDQARLSRTAIGIARMIEDELRCQHLRSIDKRAYKHIVDHAKTKGQYSRQSDVIKFLMDKEEIPWTRWHDSACLRVGLALIDCVLKVVDLVEFYDVFDGKKTIKCLRPTKDTDEWVREHAEIMKFLNPVLEPMVVEPKPWVPGELQGGYWTDHIPRKPLVKTRRKSYLEELKYAHMPDVVKAVNAAQNTAWRINDGVRRLVDIISKTDSELGDIPRVTAYEIPEKPHDIDTNEQARREYRARAAQAYKDNVNLTSRRLSFLQVFETAKKYQKYDRMYFPAQLDFRGRVYFVPQLNPQGPDWMKGLLEFADGMPLGELGLQWLKVHVANLFGVDKVSFLDRIQWVDDNMDMILAIAEHPMENTQWADADKPFQAYAAALEMAKAYKSGDPESYVSRIPIAFDGSCSGIQNLSLAFRDEVGGEAVNLLAKDKPSDIYQLVADKTIVQLNADLKSDNEEIRKLAQWWLDFGITRKVTKRNCMTFPYGSKQRGFSDQLIEDFLRPFIKVSKADALRNPLLTLDDKGKPTTSLNIMSLSNYLAKINYASVQQTVLKAAEAMEWMQNAARMVAKEGRPVCWTTPLGLPVVQAYVKSKEARVETSIAGKRAVLSIREETLKPDTRKAANSISPNIVHSLDASHLMLTVSMAVDEGINAFALVHDSFATHAGRSTEFFDIIRGAFIELYKDDVFQDLAEQFKSQISESKLADFPALPTKGKLDPEEIRQSNYCFA